MTYEPRQTMTHEQLLSDYAERQCHDDTMVAPGPMERELWRTIRAHAEHLERQAYRTGDYQPLHDFLNLSIEAHPVGA
jgi:hypothetical protein